MFDLYYYTFINTNVFLTITLYCPINFYNDTYFISVLENFQNTTLLSAAPNPLMKIFNNNIYIFYEYYIIYIYIYYYFFIFLFLFIYLYIYLFSTINSFSINLFFLNMLTEIEKELNSIDDLIYIIFIFFSFFSYSFFFYSLLFFINYSNIVLFFFIYNIQLVLILIPTFLLYDYGFYFIIYIRGSTSSSIFLYENILDYINIIAYCLRVIIQLVRLVVILVTFFTFSELYLEYYYYFYNIYICKSFNHSQSSYSLIIFFLILVGHWLFEFVHLIFIFILQTVAFNVMILWLFQFLFTLFFFEILENFFIKLRK